jgi:VanZ family protein
MSHFPMLSTAKKLHPLFVLLFWLLLVYFSYLMLREEVPRNDGWIYGDKVAHGIAFLILSVTANLAFKQTKTIIAGLAFYGALIEVLQANFTMTRSGDPYDWLADLAGILLCFLMFKWIQRVRHRATTT